jgi:hypothetical protein
VERLVAGDDLPFAVLDRPPFQAGDDPSPASDSVRPRLARTIGIRPTQVSGLIAKAREENLIVARGKVYALNV